MLKAIIIMSFEREGLIASPSHLGYRIIKPHLSSNLWCKRSPLII